MIENKNTITKLPDQSLTMPTGEPAKAQQSASETDTIELSVSPKLPDQISLKKAEQPKAMVKVDAVRPQSGERYVILTIDVKEEIPDSIPFSIDPDRLTFGVHVPDGVGAQYFQLGNTLTYSIGGKKIHLKPIASFSNKADAEAQYKETKNKWHELSPFETMNLGKGPWGQK